MTIHHHISDALLLDYAAGSLEEGWSLAVATHLSLCPHCRKRLVGMEMIAGAMLDGLEDSDQATTSLETSWAEIKARLKSSRPEDSHRAQPVAPPASATKKAVLPDPLRRYVGGDIDTLKWKPLGLGAYHYPITTGDKAISVRLLRIPAGLPVPEHTHAGKELTVVLCGSFTDSNGRFVRGDFEEADDTLIHQPMAEAGEDCICLAVTDAPLRFKSRFMRLIQPLIGI